jgi:hypothetical protein
MRRHRTAFLLPFLPIFGLFAQSPPASRSKGSVLPSDLIAKVRENLKISDKQACLDSNHLSLEQAVSTRWLYLNEAAGPSLVVQGLAPCLAGAGNGPILVYGQFYDGWRKILDAEGHQIQESRARSKGWSELDVWQQQSPAESIRRNYRFDGYEYKAAGCEMVQLVDPATGKPLPKPITSRCAK